MIVPDVPSDGDVVFWASGLVSITEAVNGGVCILSSIMHTIGQGTREITKDAFCSCVVTEFGCRIML